MSKFNIGDRVILTEDYPDICGCLYAGEIGTVCDITYAYETGVRFDNKYAFLHMCDGNCESGHGWYVADSQLELYLEEEAVADSITVSDLSSMLGIGG